MIIAITCIFKLAVANNYPLKSQTKYVGLMIVDSNMFDDLILDGRLLIVVSVLI